MHPPETPQPFFQVFKKTMKLIAEHWAVVTVMFGFAATCWGLLSLKLYAGAIGRPDLFLASLGAGGAVGVLAFAVAVSMFAYMLVLSTTTILFGLAVSMFKDVAIPHKKVVVWLAVPAVAGFTCFVLGVFFVTQFLPNWSQPLIAALITVVIGGILVLMYRVGPLGDWIEAIHQQQQRQHIRRSAVFGHLFMLFLVISAMVGASALPMILAINAYTGEDTSGAIPRVAVLSVLTLTLTLLPVIVFYWSSHAVYKRALYSAMSVVIVFVLFAMLWPGALGNITYSAATGLDIRQHTLNLYVLEDQLELSELDSAMWKTRLRNNKPEIEAFQLFSLGDVLLLCPGKFLGLDRKKLQAYTGYCIRTLNSRVLRKPRLPRLPQQTYPRWICFGPIWKVKAERWFGCEALSQGLALSLPKRTFLSPMKSSVGR